VRFAELVAASADVAATSSRTAKVARLAAALRALAPEEVRAGTAMLGGALRQRQTGVGWRSLAELPPAAAEPSLTVAEVDAAAQALAAASGPGSRTARAERLGALMARATAAEQRHLRALLTGELRQGASASVVADAVAAAAGVPVGAVRRAAMLGGDLGAVAAVALAEGEAGLARIGLRVGRPVQPMLAASAGDLAAALHGGAAAVDWKLDGARIQVHRDGGDVGIWTRTLDEVTGRLPEVVAAALALPASSFVLDGEAIALRADGRPLPFQETAARFASRRGGDAVPLTALHFDVLHADGEDLLDRPLRERRAVLEAVVPDPAARVPSVVAHDEAAARAVLEDALARGHEGVVVKALDAPYAAGRRGAAWQKVKPVHTLDLVVLAAEWGHGRRRGWLSNLHLGARHEDGHVMLGKTFKGLTDAMLAWQTEALLALETHREGIAVHVRPELVAEIAFDGVQRSPRYRGGVALRFARVVRHRPDKPAAEADELAAVLALAPG
jgi:DNA ligase 1